MRNNKPNSTGKLYSFNSDVNIFEFPTVFVDNTTELNCEVKNLIIPDQIINTEVSNLTTCFGSQSNTCLVNFRFSYTLKGDGVILVNEIFFEGELSNGLLTTDLLKKSLIENNKVPIFDDNGILKISGNNGYNLVTLTVNSLLIPNPACQIKKTCVSSIILFNDTFVSPLNNVIIPDSNTKKVTLNINLSGNLNTFDDLSGNFKYKLYKFNKNANSFLNPPFFTSKEFNSKDLISSNIITTDFDINGDTTDGNYIMKTIFTSNVNTEFGKILNIKKSSENKGLKSFGVHTKGDKYFIILRKPDKPEFTSGKGVSQNLSDLKSISIVIDEETLLPGNSIRYPASNGDIIVSLNGLTLSEGLDYTLEPVNGDINYNVLKPKGELIVGDVINYTYTNSTNEQVNNLKADKIIVNNIISGSTGNEGNNKIYYNSDTSRFEIYTENEGSGDYSVTINGVSLANGLDYVKSTTNPKRIILMGDILLNDIIIIYYNIKNNIEGIVDNNSTIQWVIDHEPKNELGYFTLQISTDKTFTTTISEVIIKKEIDKIGYSAPLVITGNLGDTLYYRVINTKKILNVCGLPVITSTISDVVKFKVQSNLINSY